MTSSEEIPLTYWFLPEFKCRLEQIQSWVGVKDPIYLYSRFRDGVKELIGPIEQFRVGVKELRGPIEQFRVCVKELRDPVMVSKN